MIIKKFAKWMLCAGLAAAAVTVKAGPIEFDFKDPKKVNNALFLLDAPLESISGTATGITGKVTFDPASPAATRGKIILDAKTLHVDNPVMREHMLDKGWMDVAKHPKIEFVAEKFTNVKTSGTKTSAKVEGKFSVKGVTRKINVPVELTYLKGMLAKRNRVPGDLLVLRSDFTIKRSDYKIKPGDNEEKVSDVIEIMLRLAGAAPQGK